MSLVDARKAEVVSKALEMIANDRYSIMQNEDGDTESITIATDASSFAELKKYFSACSESVKDREYMKLRGKTCVVPVHELRRSQARFYSQVA